MKEGAGEKKDLYIVSLLKALLLSVLFGVGPFLLVFPAAFLVFNIIGTAILAAVIFIGIPVHFTLLHLGLTEKWIYVTSGALVGILILPILGILDWVTSGALHVLTGVKFSDNQLQFLFFYPWFLLAGMNVARVFYNVMFAEKIKSQPPKMKISHAWKILTQRV